MRQALWIFRKDVRHLRIQIAITLVLQCAFTVSNILSSPLQIPETERVNSIALWSSIFLVLSWWYLLALAIHDEALPGTRQFWVTRPYSWRSLLAAKILFAFAFINIPIFISDCAILGSQGFPVLQNIPPLLFRQIPFSLFFILPALALAALTSGITQLLMGVLLIAVGWLLESAVFSGGHSRGVSLAVFSGNWISEWISAAVFFAIASSILCWEYRTRRTNQMRMVSALLLFVAPFWSAMPLWKLENPAIVTSRTPPSADTAGIQLGSRIAPKYVASNPSNVLEINLPLAVTGLPPDTGLEGVERSLRYRRPGQDRFEELKFGAFLAKRPDGYWLPVDINPRQYQQIRSEPITLRVTLNLMLISAKPEARIPVGSRESTRLRDFGDCKLVTQAFFTPPGVLCRAALWIPQRTEIQVRARNMLEMSAVAGSSFDSPFPIMKGLSPVDKSFVPLTTTEVSENQVRGILRDPSSEIVFVPQYPLGRLERTVELPNIRLENYDSTAPK